MRKKDGYKNNDPPCPSHLLGGAVVALLALFIFYANDAKAAGALAKAKVKTPMVAPLEIAGWIPFWKKEQGAADALAHLDAFTEISPFAYTVKKDGTLFDALKIDEAPWPALIAAAQQKKIKVLPSILWDNADAIHAVLKSPTLRKAHIASIIKTVTGHGFDGIDIDYEGKNAETKKYFSLFLRDLYKAIGKKLVSCTIEARTPLDARFITIPKDITYANEYADINNYCDRVRIMTYDQIFVDLKLNKTQGVSAPYAPVADPQWVEKVIDLAAQTIAKKKIRMGVVTYGYGFDLTPTARGYDYQRLFAFNPQYALDIARQNGIIPQRNTAGELSFLYNPLSSTTITAAAPLVENIPSGNALPATSSLPDQTTADHATNTPLRLLWWSDAQAVKDKIALARTLGVRGISIFKIDGGEDPALWEVLK